MFFKLQEQGNIIKTIISTINSDTKGAGKSYFYSVMKAQQIQELPLVNRKLNNISKVIGDYTTFEEFSKLYPELSYEEKISKLKEGGYVEFKGTYIKPTTINGFASVYGTLFNTQLWERYFPYNKENVKDIFNKIVVAQTNELNTIDEKADMMKDLALDYKAFLYGDITFIKNKYGSMKEAREELFYDTATNKSLNSIIAEIKENKEVYKFNNPIIDGLILGTPTKTETILGKKPQRFKYANAAIESLSEEKNIASIVNMLIDDKEIGVFNDKMVTTKDLAEMILMYGLLKGGNQGLTDTLRYFPPVLLDYIGVYKDVKRNEDVFLSNEKYRYAFGFKFIQNNPELFYNEELEKYLTDNSMIGDNKSFVTYDGSDGGKMRATIVLQGDATDSFFVYRNVKNKEGKPTTMYQKIDTAGYYDVKEYTFDTNNEKSLVWVNSVDGNTPGSNNMGDLDANNQDVNTNNQVVNTNNNIQQPANQNNDVNINTDNNIQQNNNSNTIKLIRKTKKEDYISRTFDGKNILKSGYLITIPNLSNVKLYITQESVSSDSTNTSTEFNIKNKEWFVEIEHPTKGFMILPKLDIGVTNLQDTLIEVEKNINKHIKTEHGSKLLKEVGIVLDNTTTDNSPIELSLYDEYSEILKEKGVTEEQFNEISKEFSEEQIMEYINKCK
jgi:hypothetical protein